MARITTVRRCDMETEDTNMNRTHGCSILSCMDSSCQSSKMEVDRIGPFVQSSSVPQMDLLPRVGHLTSVKDVVFRELQNTGVCLSDSRDSNTSCSPKARYVNAKEKSASSFLCMSTEINSKLLSRPSSSEDSGVHTSSVEFRSGGRPYWLPQPCSLTAANPEESLEKDMEQDYFHSFAEANLVEDEKVSNSSLTLAANRSLDMSRSLTDRCFQVADLAASGDNLATSERVVRKRTRKSVPINIDNCSTFKANDSNDRTYSNKFSCTDSKSSPQNSRNSSSKASSVSEESLSPKSVQRYHVVQEVLETERKYCSCLLILLRHFAEKLLRCEFVEQSDISIIFPPCLLDIYNAHKIFLEKLEQRVIQWTEFTTVTDLFCQLLESVNCDLLVQYQRYVALFPNAILHVRQLCHQSGEVERFVRDLEKENCCQGLDIGAYLLTPIQRIPRYVLLLKQLGKSTRDSHPDSYLIESCLSTLGEFLSHLNTSIETSMQLVSMETLPRQKKRFTLNTLSFRGSVVGDPNGSLSSRFRTQKSSSLPKGNRVSLDLSFLGALRQKKQVEVPGKLTYSETCLHGQSSPAESMCLPPDIPLTSTPQHSSVQQTSHSRKGVLPFRLQKTKRKLEDHPASNSTANTSELSNNSRKIKVKKTGNTDASASRGLSVRLQESGRAFLHRFRRTGTSSLSDTVKEHNNESLETSCYTTTDRPILKKRHIPTKLNLEESVAGRFNEQSMTGDDFNVSWLSPVASEMHAERSNSNFSCVFDDTVVSANSADRTIVNSLQNTHGNASPSFLTSNFPPVKKSRIQNSTTKMQVDAKNVGEVKRKMSVKDVIKNFFIRKGSTKGTNYSSHNSRNDSYA